MSDFSGWVKALELPAKITGGVFIGCLLVYVLDRSGELVLADIGTWVRPVIVLVGILSGCLFFASILSDGWQASVRFWRSHSESRDKEKAETEARERALKHLDQLSEQELYMVCEAIRENSPSFTSWAYISAGAQLVDKGLLIQHQGRFHTDHWPYTFHDFVWEEIEKRQDEFLRAEKAKKAEKEKAKRRGR